MRNYMDAAGPLCILLQQLQSDPSSVTERSAMDLVLKSLRLLGHGVASVNKQRRQEIVKHCIITDVTQLAKQSFPMQTFLFGESKASELNFVRDLAEKVSKVVQSKKNSNSNKTKFPYKQARTKSFKLSSGSSKPRNLSSHEHQPFRKAPFWGKREPATNPVTRISGRKLQCKQPPTNQFRFRGKHCRYDFPFSCPSKGTSPSKGSREVAVCRPELADNYTRPLGSTDHTGLQNRTVKPSLVNQPPFPPVLSPPQTSLVQEEIISLLQKGAIIKVAFNPWVGFYSNLFLVEKKVGTGKSPVINLSRFNNYVEHCHFKREDLKAVADLLSPGDFMCKLDLKDAYFSVPLHRRSQKFVRFQFKAGLTNSLGSHLG